MRGLLQLALDFLDAPSAQHRPAPSTERLSPPILGPAAVPVPPGPQPEPQSIAMVSPSDPDVVCAHAYTHPHANRQTRLGAVPVAYEFKRGRRRTIGMAVGEAGLTVSAPRWTPMHEVDAVLQEKAAWIVRKLHEMQARQQRAQTARLEWRAGTVLPWLGQPLTLALAQRGDSADQSAPIPSADQPAAPPVAARTAARRRTRRTGQAVLEGAETTVSDTTGRTLRLDLPADAPPVLVREVVHAWFLEEARALFAQRLDHYAPLLQVTWRKLALSNARTRWGSASSDGRIHLNWRLMHMPLKVIDYVVVHELSHLRVMDHSPRFWDTVRSVMPDYQDHRQHLRVVTLPIWGD
ncbi:metal-dependent hydrolase [Hylemonella gracilis str. Niagara R]|uniref:Metal-dependent hydrolase n=2 Tax=Hylemonella gracilis TaxID=80880 RepID=A0A016XMC2_9BURK|nr:metal-dependent hydrolase [Hylemonella gracilis str. Niagara R]